MNSRMVMLLFMAIPLTLVSHAIANEQIPIWPATPPGDEGLEMAAEQDTSGPDGRTVAGKQVIRLGNVAIPTLEVYQPEQGQANGTAVVICPGGGHRILAYDLEGTEVAQWLQSIGVTAFVLKYRVPAREGRPLWHAAVQDAQRAMSFVRANAKQWSLNPKRIGILGFSAGGQTAALASLLKQRQYEAIDEVDKTSLRPDFSVLIYPAYLVEKGAENQLVDDVTVTDGAPPMFLAHAWDDGVTPQSSIQLASALKQVGVKAELHLFDRGGHGYGMRPTEDPVTHWPKLCARWMEVNGWIPSAQSTDERQIRELLARQEAAWNGGDIDAFMKDYWQSEDLAFSSGGETTKGWEATRQRYHDRYPTAERMGKTTFSDIQVQLLDAGSALVQGRWQLERSDEVMKGNFTLVLKRFEDGWKIIHDHTSKTAE